MDNNEMCNISKKDFRKLYILSESIYNSLVVVDYFCKNQKDIEELNNLAPVIKNLRNDADILYTYFIDF